jgi:arginine exporter protein ArgO
MVLAIGVVIVMFVLSAEVPALGNPVVLATGAVVALWLGVRALRGAIARPGGLTIYQDVRANPWQLGEAI